MSGLQVLETRTQVEVVCPSVSWLGRQILVVCCYVVRVEDAVNALGRIALGEILADEVGVDCAVDNNMRNVDVHWPEFARHALCQRAQRVLGSRERGEVGRAAKARSRAGEEDRPAAARHHAPGRFPSIQEAAEAGHLPYLEVLARGFLKNAGGYIRANVEDHHLDRPDLALDPGDEFDYVLLLAGIGAEAHCRPTLRFDLLDQRLELVGLPTHDARDHAFARETPCDRAAGRVPRPDHQRDGPRFLIAIRHDPLLYLTMVYLYIVEIKKDSRALF